MMDAMRLSARTAAAALTTLGFENVTPAALRHWRQRGHIGPGPGYDPVEIAAYLRRRETRRRQPA